MDAEGRAVGTAGHVAAFAFYANKQMTTGEGGVLVPAGEEMAEALRSERNQGRSPDMSQIDHPRIGFNYRITDVQAAIGIAQVERLDETACRPGRGRGRLRRAARAQAAAHPPAARGIPTASSCPAPTAATSSAAGSSTRCSCPWAPTATP